MKIEEIAARKNISMENAGDVVEEMKGCRYIPQPDIEHAVKALDPKLHDINNPILRPDKKVKIDVDDEDNGESAQKVIEVDGETTNTRTEKVARNAVALQKLIIKRAVSFCFGNPDLSTICKRDANSLSVGLWNFFEDSVPEPVVTLDRACSGIEFLNCSGRLEGDKVYLSEIPPFGFAGFTVK